jgi:hypothetical protein
MSEGITEAPRPGGTFELAYVLDVQDHVAHQLWRSGEFQAPWSARLTPRFFLGAFVAVVLALSPLIAALYSNNLDRYLQNIIVFLSLFGVLMLIFLVTVPVSPSAVMGAGTPDVRRELVRAAVLDAAAKNLIRLGRRDRVSFDAAGFLEVNDYREEDDGFGLVEHKETRVPWHLVVHVGVADEHVFLVVAGKGNLIVPRRIFADEAALAAFIEAVQTWRRAAAPRGYAPPDERIIRD